MENATEALYMAFAVAIFSIALTISMTMFSQARATSDAILYNNDETNFMEYDTTIGSTIEERTRIVGLETVVPTLFKYYKENYTVLFRRATINDYENNQDISNTTALKLYNSQTNEMNWAKEGIETIYNGKNYRWKYG